jgi:hypothetical protein
MDQPLKRIKTEGLYSAARSAIWSGRLNADNPHQALIYLINKIVLPVVNKKNGREDRRKYAAETFEDMVNTQANIISSGDNLFLRFSATDEDLELHKTAALEHCESSCNTMKEMLASIHVKYTEKPCHILQIDVHSLREAIVKGRETPAGKFRARLHAEKMEQPDASQGINPS